MLMATEQVAGHLQPAQGTGDEENGERQGRGGVLGEIFTASWLRRRRECFTFALCSQKAILKYNPKYKDQWSFDALAEFFKVHVSRMTAAGDTL